MTRSNDTMQDVRLVQGPVAPASLAPFPPHAGAECVFVGRTREDVHAEHGTLVRLEYEAYEPMALRVMQSLAHDAVAAGAAAVRLHHALGSVPVGDASVLVQVAAPHRDAAFTLCRTLIDRTKSEVPIWKREVWRTGASSWVPGTPISQPLTDVR